MIESWIFNMNVVVPGVCKHGIRKGNSMSLINLRVKLFILLLAKDGIDGLSRQLKTLQG